MTAPQRPPPPAVAAMRAAMGGATGLWLQLGVTPEIARLPERSIAIDWNAAIIARAWPGGAPAHRVILADWRDLPLAPDSCDGAIGDGSLTMLRWPGDYRALLARLATVLRRGARAVLRCFVSPDRPESAQAVCDDAFAGRIASFGAFRMRINMAAAAARDWTVTSDEAHGCFTALVLDRAALASATGWSAEEIATIDRYAGSSALHSYPSRAALVETLPPELAARWITGAGYELAERCPLLVLERT